ncbi:MAG: hypothetical protein LRY27_04350, partial [Chitinophagales bacterium]|nr:hypothetical protein [Chitinophagales bacterium]
FCQNNLNRPFINQSLTSKTATDSLSKDTITTTQTQIDTVNIVFDDGDIEHPISYKAADSIVYDVINKKLYLYGSAYMQYGDLELESEEIDFEWETSTLKAKGKVDSLGNLAQRAKFKDASGEYETDSIEYNFKTQKGRTYHVVTEQDGAYIHSEIVQKNQYNEWYGYKTKYTTCTNIDHPHFYLGAKRSKVVPNKVMVTGPVNLVVEGVKYTFVFTLWYFPYKNRATQRYYNATIWRTTSIRFLFK